MKILIYITYFFRSLRLRGFLNTLKLLVSEIRYERKFGIKTSKIKPSDSKMFYHYQGAGYLALLNVLSDMVKETKNFRFVDIGCGKGRALFMAEHCGYKNMVGLELDKDLLTNAEENIERYKTKSKDSTFNLIHGNALDFDYGNEQTVYFLFNPFDEDVLGKVLKRILNQGNSDLWFIYMNPLYPEPFFSENILLVKEYKVGRYTEALVFERKALNS